MIHSCDPALKFSEESDFYLQPINNSLLPGFVILQHHKDLNISANLGISDAERTNHFIQPCILYEKLQSYHVF